MRLITLCLFMALILVMGGLTQSKIIAQDDKFEEKSPLKGEQLKGSRWTMKAGDTEGWFTFTKDDGKGAVEGLWIHSRTEMGKWSGTYKDGFLKIEMVQQLPEAKKGTKYNAEVALLRGDDKTLGTGIGWWKEDKKGSDEKLFRIVNQTAEMKFVSVPLDRKPPKDLADDLTGKKWEVEMGGKKGTIEFKLDKTAASGTVKFGEDKVEFKGAVQGTLVAVTWIGDLNRNSFTVFCKKDGKWTGYGFKLDNDDNQIPLIIRQVMKKD